MERVPWAVGRTGFTEDFEELVAYLTQTSDKTTVTKLMGISWTTVGRITDRVVARRLDTKRLDDLVVIGIDEFSYRKRHRYVTVVVDHDRSRIVWAAEGKSSDTLGAFFKLLGKQRRGRILAATIDLGGAYIKALREWLPKAVIIFDRFHVQRLASDAVDEVRRDEVRRLGGQAAASIKNSRFVLLKNPKNLNRAQRRKLSALQRTNRRVYRAYLLKETLAQAFEAPTREAAARELKDWAAWAMRSKLEPFKRLARTIRKHIDGILNYIETPYTNAVVEGFNNRMRMVARRAFGYHSARALIAMMFLCCGGVQLKPPLP
jgi:transposase